MKNSELKTKIEGFLNKINETTFPNCQMTIVKTDDNQNIELISTTNGNVEGLVQSYSEDSLPINVKFETERLFIQLTKGSISAEQWTNNNFDNPEFN